jgi:uncharacterized membrane protein
MIAAPDVRNLLNVWPWIGIMINTILNETKRSEMSDVDRIEEGGDGRGLARALGYFSIGLGAAEVAAPRAMAKLIGLHRRTPHAGLLRAFGLREIGSGLSILARPSAAPVGSRVVGDVLDAAVLLAVLGGKQTRKKRALVALAAVLGVAALDVYCTQRLRKARSVANGQQGVQVKKAITISRPPEEVYGFWRDFKNLPRFMSHLLSVEILDDKRSHWTARAPAGQQVEWRAELSEDVPNQQIAWRSLPGGDVEHAGSVSFRPAPGNRGTEIVVDLTYAPPAGSLGRVIASLFGEEPAQQIDADLRVLKQVLETGEVVQSDASIRHGLHPARPSRDSELLAEQSGRSAGSLDRLEAEKVGKC